MDPPSAVITARTRAVAPRSATSWAAGLVALGVVAGIVVALFLRGDADSLVGATASIVDPAHPASVHATGAAAQSAVLPAFIEPAPAPAPAPVPVAAAAAPVPRPTVEAVPTSSPAPSADKPAPRASFVIARAPRAMAPAPVAVRAAPTSTGGWLSTVTPAGAGAPIVRPSRGNKNSSEFANAAAADALAKAQLAASLQ
jgi:pyruvate dehydrogenase E2 component (dihydrolipoamide acetyltransferase)